MNTVFVNKFQLSFLLVLGISLMGFHQPGFTQTNTDGFLVTGKVNNPQGEKAVGASILVKGTTIGTATDTLGFFTLKVPSKESILVISHFSTSKSTEVSLQGSSKLVVLLPSDVKELAEQPDNRHTYPIVEKVQEKPQSDSF
jgi:hypothetical protein